MAYDANLQNGLVHHWRTESMYDSGSQWIIPNCMTPSANIWIGNSVTLERDPDPWGREDRAVYYRFSGNGRSYYTYSNGADNWTDYTVAFWIRPDTDLTGDIIERDASNQVNGFSIAASSGAISFTSKGSNTTSGGVLANSTWCHVVCRRIGTSITVWANGVLQSTNASASGTALGYTDGQPRIGFGDQMTCALYDIRMYSRGISDEEIWQLYSGLAEFQSSSVAQYPTLMNGMSHYWQFGVDYRDRIGTTNLSIPFSKWAFPTTDRFGRENMALDFKPPHLDRGSGICIRIPTEIYTDPYTWITWVYHRPDWWAFTYYLVTKNRSTPNFFRGFGTNRYTDNPGNVLGCHSNAGAWVNSGFQYYTNEWNFVCHVHSGTNVYWFLGNLSGTLNKGSTQAVGWANSSGTLGGIQDIGCYDNSGGNTWVGKIASCMMWDRILSDDEVRAVYDISRKGDFVPYRAEPRLCL